jgi:hypothetical protein
MPRSTLRTSEVGEHFCEGRSGAGPRIPAILARSPNAVAKPRADVHGLFLRRIAATALLVLVCALTQTPFQVSSQIEVTAQVSLEAASQDLGHVAIAVSPRADERRLVFRRSG